MHKPPVVDSGWKANIGDSASVCVGGESGSYVTQRNTGGARPKCQSLGDHGSSRCAPPFDPQANMHVSPETDTDQTRRPIADCREQRATPKVDSDVLATGDMGRRNLSSARHNWTGLHCVEGRGGARVFSRASADVRGPTGAHFGCVATVLFLTGHRTRTVNQ